MYVCMDACDAQIATASNSFSQEHLTNRKTVIHQKCIYYSTYIRYESSGESSCGKSLDFKLTRKGKIVHELKETQLNPYFYK